MKVSDSGLVILNLPSVSAARWCTRRDSNPQPSDIFDGIWASIRVRQDLALAGLSRSSCHPDMGQSWCIHGRLYRESGGFKMLAFRARSEVAHLPLSPVSPSMTRGAKNILL